MSTRYVILGLLAQQPMSGYDIRSLFKELSWMIGSPSYGSLYPTLHTLHEEGLVDVTVQPRDGKPQRKLYTIMESGRRSLQTWLKESATPELPLKDFARRLIVVGNTTPDDLRGYLERRRGQLAEYLSKADSTGVAQGDQAETDQGQHLVHDYGLTIAHAEIDWLNERLAELERQTAAVTVPDAYGIGLSGADA